MITYLCLSKVLQQMCRCADVMCYVEYEAAEGKSWLIISGSSMCATIDKIISITTVARANPPHLKQLLMNHVKMRLRLPSQFHPLTTFWNNHLNQVQRIR